MVTKIKGFTLVEILVVLTLIGVLFVAGYAGLRDFSRRQALESVKRSVQGDIKLAQQLAITGKKPSDCPAQSVLDGYYFIVVDSETYVVSPQCNNAGVYMSCVFSPSTIPCYKRVSLLDKRVTISPTGVPSLVAFKVIGQGTNIPASETRTITLTSVDSGATTTITVKSGGEIQ